MSNAVPASNLARATELMPAVGLTGVIVMMVLPVPAFLLDLSLVMSIALSLTILIVSLYVKEALDFAAFPTVLLFSTLLRLSLNVASTRLILLRGEEGTAAAGHVIEAFGQFVVAGNYAVGFIIFAILVIINFVVITKGATRIANPGCYATALQLAVAPLVPRLSGPPSIFGVSGYSGAGTTPSPRNDALRLRDNLMPYKLVGHNHEREATRHEDTTDLSLSEVFGHLPVALLEGLS